MVGESPIPVPAQSVVLATGLSSRYFLPMTSGVSKVASLSYEPITKLPVNADHPNIFTVSMESTSKYLLRKNKGLSGHPACILSPSHTGMRACTHTYTNIYVRYMCITTVMYTVLLFIYVVYPKVDEI
jgi:hypothetical protein